MMGSVFNADLDLWDWGFFFEEKTWLEKCLENYEGISRFHLGSPLRLSLTVGVKNHLFMVKQALSLGS